MADDLQDTWARLNNMAHGDLGPLEPKTPPRMVREVVFGEEDFDKLFMCRFICRTCGPTNQVCADETGFICMVCQQDAAYRVFDQIKIRPS